MIKQFAFLILILVSSAKADECRQFEEQALCKPISSTDGKAFAEIQSFPQEVNFHLKDKSELNCKMGLKDGHTGLQSLVQFETSRLAPWLQKLQAIRESRSFIESSETADLDRLEKVIKDSSLLSYSGEVEALAEQMRAEKVWNPNQFTSVLRQQTNQVQKKLEEQKFPEALLKEMSFARNAPERCSQKDSVLKFLADAAKKDSPRLYHFKKTLLQQLPVRNVATAFQKCSSQKASSSSDFCQKQGPEQMRNLEAEYEEQVCALKQLFPKVGSQLNKISLEIPSVAGDLVTEGPGARPTAEEAKSKNFRWNIACREDFSLGGIARAAAGAGASFLTHELAHEGVSKVVGEKLHWNPQKGIWKCMGCSENIRPIAIAGLLSHNLGSEYIVRNQSHDSQFQKGWLFFNVYNTAAYFGKDWLARSGKIKGDAFAGGTADRKGAGDLRAFSNKESYVLGTLMIGHQLFSAYRYLQNRQNHQCKKEW